MPLLAFPSVIHTVKCWQKLFEFVREVRSLELWHPERYHIIFSDLRESQQGRWENVCWPEMLHKWAVRQSHLKKGKQEGIGTPRKLFVAHSLRQSTSLKCHFPRHMPWRLEQGWSGFKTMGSTQSKQGSSSLEQCAGPSRTNQPDHWTRYGCRERCFCR